MKNIGIDIDGVLADFNKALAIELGHSPVHQHPDRWDWPRHIASPHTVDRVWDHITKWSQWWFDFVKPYPEAANIAFIAPLTRLADEHNIYFITARPQVPLMKIYTELWLKTYMRQANPTVILAKDKGDVAAGIGLTHFIDDNADNVDRVAEATGGLCHTMLLDRPYNRDKEYQNVERIRTLGEFIDRVRG